MLNNYIKTNPSLCGVFYFKNAFSKEECNFILDNYVNKQHQIDTIRREDRYEISGSYAIKPDKNSKWIYDRFEKYAFYINEKEYKFNIVSIQGVHILEYKENDILDWHIDLIGKESFTLRKISLAVYLSDRSEYEGGQILFDIREKETPNQIIPMEQGSIVIFPSFLHHKVSRITSGVRRSLICKACGPPFV